MKRLHVLALIALTAVGVLASISPAQAAPSDALVYKYSFGEDLNLKFGQMAVNYATGNLLVAASDGNIHQFDPNGDPVEFSAAGSFTIPAGSNFSVDNSGGPTQGNIYVTVAPNLADGAPGYLALRADGSPIGTGYAGPGAYVPLYEGLGGGSLCAVTPAPDGNIWLALENVSLAEVTPNGVLTGRQANLVGSQTFSYRCTMMFDGAGNFYSRSGAAKYDASDFSYLGETGLNDRLNVPLAIDPSTLDLYQANEAGGSPGNPIMGSVLSVPYADPLVEQTPLEALSATYGIKRAGGAAFDASGQTLYLAEGFSPGEELSKIRVFHREPPSVPYDLTQSIAIKVRSQESGLRAGLSAGGAPVSYRFEYGTSTAYGQSTQPTMAPFSYYGTEVVATALNLEPGTTYHVRLVATNSAGTAYGSDSTFTTYPVPPGAGADPCPNALARKQTIAARLPDCRAYELASAPDTGGYDVESYLAPGQAPLPGFPLATDRLLYAIHSGAVPGPWNATNKGPDPYLATRTSSGWVTDYKGLPADINPAAGPFSSVLGEADSSLSTLAFAGQNLCDPCFSSGLKTGIPLRLPSGQLAQGMAGSLSGSVPNTAAPEGRVAKLFSADGNHLLFASKYAFGPGANTGGNLTVYDRNLSTGTTQIASTDASGNPLTGTVSELDVSANGSRIVTATKTGEDAQGNELTHPYMHIGSSPNSVDLAPSATAGVLYAGMTSDGSKAFFTTTDKLLGSDTDDSADLYEAAVDSSGNLTLRVITPTSSDACSPLANANGEHWNTGSSIADCSAVAISGGGGVAAATGAAYFLSPEQLDGTKGTVSQPNLYLAQPGGSPVFVATLEPDNPLVLDSVKANAVRRTGDFQTTASGGYAAFVSGLDLTALSTHGFRSVYRFEAGTGQIDCASCDRTGASDAKVFGTAELPPSGLALLGDGRLFFTTAAQLVLNDANGKKDVYQWSVGDPLLISAGAGPFDSGLLTASADGTDVFFFTQDTLASGEDFNGSLVKIYDARTGGGFFKLPASVPCQASDECHGPGALPGSAPDIRSSGKTTTGNVLVCPKNRVKKRGKCVKKPVQRKKKAKKNAKKRDTKTTRKRGGRNA